MAFIGGLIRGAVGLARGGAGKTVGKLAGKAGAWVGRQSGIIKPAAKVAGAIGVGAAGTVIGERMVTGDWGGGGGGNLFGLPMVTDAIPVEALRAPRGYVLIQNPESDDPNDKVAVLKEVAYALKLRKRPVRGGISAAEIRAARRVQRVIGQLTVARKPRMPLRKGRRA
jgi:hypothetical protein